MMRTTVIVPTYNRPHDLTACLTSIARQTRPPDELLVVDDGDLEELPCRDILERAGVRCLHLKKDEKGLTRSRNLGVRHASGDIIFFFDDDVVLESTYLESMVGLYRTLEDPKLGGIGGIDLNTPPSSPITYPEYIYNVLFLISPPRSGRLTAAGFSEHLLPERVFPDRTVRRVQILGGCLFSFHRKVFEFFSFAEDYPHPYCQGEDKDFCLRVSQRFNLYINPQARLYHNQSPVMRVNKYRRGRDYVLSNYRNFNLYCRKNRAHVLLFFYASLGYLLKKFVAALIKAQGDEAQRVRGILDAIATIARNEFGCHNTRANPSCP
ncbi:MAG: glycosyl transferase, family 2 [Desulfacinum sp.]|jgi:glycosyltransferase involved in cell wall biosynthesis|nr:glycosyl transferase, family 2 [Desulfacinum sp.]